MHCLIINTYVLTVAPLISTNKCAKSTYEKSSLKTTTKKNTLKSFSHIYFSTRVCKNWRVTFPLHLLSHMM